MRFVLAPDKFKGALTGFEFCGIVTEGLRTVFPKAEIVSLPLADGGDGTMEVIKHYLEGTTVQLMVKDPLFRTVESGYLLSQDRRVAYIEMAEASGLKLLATHEYDCLNATTYGTGELIKDAMDSGAREIILGIGGSATNDGGMGMAQALGYCFLDTKGDLLSGTGANLSKIATIACENVHPGITQTHFQIACDVTNPFYGPHGAAHVYARQKGATETDINVLDTGLRHMAERVLEKYAIDLQQLAGSGAAGGIGGGCVAFLGARLRSGIDLIKELAGFDKALENTDWIITGEGRLDGQTLSGKAISGVLQSARKRGIPVAALCGSVEMDKAQQLKLGLSYVNAISAAAANLEQAIKKSKSNLLRSTIAFAEQLGY